MNGEWNEADAEAIGQAIDLLKATEYYQRVYEDLDFNFTAGVDHLERAVKGEVWQ